MKWTGGADWRYSQTNSDDNLNTKDANGRDTSTAKTKAHEIRANIGATGGWENVEWGVGVRTTNTANDDFTTMTNNSDLAIGVGQAWFRYLQDFGSMNLNITAGRQKNVLAYDAVSQNLFDNDVRWDGLGWQLNFGMFGLNMAQYVLGAKQGATAGAASTVTNTAATEADAGLNQKFNYLFAFQPHMNWKFTDEIEAMFAVGYYMWKDMGGANAIPATTGATATNFALQNLRQWHFLTGWTLPYNLNFNGELVMANKQKYDVHSVGLATVNPEAGRSAWSLGLTYGALKKAHDFTVGYAYGTKGIASVDNRYTYEKFAADNQGHTINVGYALADNFTIGWKGLFLKEKEKINPANGLAYTTNQEHKTTYWELTAGVMF
jgi:hypothetical protein